ncbi:hypothetical protein [Actinomadura napierensis]|uniref:Uncharacterized protein n=1 Tax=Actinomadura napierensis TaxID=267854 RepID=A0ABN2YKN6_9ACTN
MSCPHLSAPRGRLAFIIVLMALAGLSLVLFAFFPRLGQAVASFSGCYAATVTLLRLR